MKNIFKIFIVTLITGSFISACTEIEVKPKSSWEVNDFYKTEQEANIALAGMYSYLASDKVYGQAFSILMEAGTDEGYYGKRWNEAWTVALYRHTSADKYVKELWTTLYSCINMTNMFMAKIQKDAFEEEDYNRLLGEAKFIRGLCYFHLTNWYGDVPLRLDFTKDQNANNFAASPAKTIYEQVVKDFSFAADNLYHPSDSKYIKGRASNMAAHGLLARVYLRMSGYPLNEDHYEEAKHECEIIMEDGFHGLTQASAEGGGYRTHFLSYVQNKYDLNESIFEISFAYLRDLGLETHGRIGAINGVAFSYGGGQNGYPSAYAFENVSPALESLYDNEDERLAWNIATYHYTNKGDVKRVPNAMAAQYCPAKFRRWEPLNWEDLDNDLVDGVAEPYVVLELSPTLTQNFTSVNFPVLRYADVLLMYAEADNALSSAPSAKAIACINEVRERAGLSKLEDEKPAVVADSDAFFKELVDERARELCFEGLRKQDLIRWGLLGEKLQESNEIIKGDPAFKANNEQHASYLRSGNNFDPAKHLTLPYPLQEVEINNMLDQKTGW
ncbi:MAG: RagB/SusD family nutrient uptake outer membrane protein [Carboxylicivirga sp.]|nr:RagB/SusD family nutrient uptake outer membrane protein [Carboxylicivirga sp.]